MTTIDFVLPDGTRRTVPAASGRSVMQTAITEDVPGIVAECGGNLMCATCHVYLEDTGAGQFPPPSEEEEEMLDSTASARHASSRLSCQLRIADDTPGPLAFRIPDAQL